MKKLLLLLIFIPLIGVGQQNIELIDIIDLIKASNIDNEIKTIFNGSLRENKVVYISPDNLNAKAYQVDHFKIANGVCDVLSIYSYKGDFVQLEIGFQNTNASLNELNRIDQLEFITSGEFYNGKAMSINYLFKYYGYAINVITLKESQKMGSFYFSSDDIFFLAVTTIEYYNSTMSENFGIKL